MQRTASGTTADGEQLQTPSIAVAKPVIQIRLLAPWRCASSPAQMFELVTTWKHIPSCFTGAAAQVLQRAGVGSDRAPGPALPAGPGPKASPRNQLDPPLCHSHGLLWPALPRPERHVDLLRPQARPPLRWRWSWISTTPAAAGRPALRMGFRGLADRMVDDFCREAAQPMAEDRAVRRGGLCQPQRQFLRVDLAGDTTVREAVPASAVLRDVPELDRPSARRQRNRIAHPLDTAARRRPRGGLPAAAGRSQGGTAAGAGAETSAPRRPARALVSRHGVGLPQRQAARGRDAAAACRRARSRASGRCRLSPALLLVVRRFPSGNSGTSSRPDEPGGMLLK